MKAVILFTFAGLLSAQFSHASNCAIPSLRSSDNFATTATGTLPEIVLTPQSFFDSSSQYSDYKDQRLIQLVNSFRATMPAELIHPSECTPLIRARQLQYAVHFANLLANPIHQLPTHKVKVLVSRDKHFLTPADPVSLDGLGATMRLLRPRISILRNDFTLEAAPGTSVKPILMVGGVYSGNDSSVVCDAYYNGTGCRGRVALFVQSGIKNVIVKGLRFEGDMTASQLLNPAYYVHENFNQTMRAAEGTSNPIAQHFGVIMVGAVNSNPNDITLDGVDVVNFSHRAIHVVGNLNLKNVVVQGVFDVPNQPATSANQKNLHDKLACFSSQTGTEAPASCAGVFAQGASLGDWLKRAIGMTYHIGLFQNGGATKVAPFKLERSTFYKLVQGAVIGRMHPGSAVTENSFHRLFDHGLYLSGKTNVDQTVISKNEFVRIRNYPFKVASHSTRENPFDYSNSTDSLGLVRSVVEDNIFRFVRVGAIYLQGVDNRISRNIIYKDSDEPYGWFNHLPNYSDIEITTDGGNAGYNNHSAANQLKDNLSQVGKNVVNTNVVVHQLNVSERSIEGNNVKGKMNQVYFTKPTHPTVYTNQSISVSNGATLIQCGEAKYSVCRQGN